MNHVRLLPCLASLLVVAGCGGGGTTTVVDTTLSGVGFADQNPSVVVAGADTEFLAFAQPVTEPEPNTTVTVNASTTVGTLEEATWTQNLGSGGGIVYHPVRLTVPAGTADGTAITLRVFRSVRRGGGTPTDDVATLNLVVGSSTVRGELVARNLTGSAGATVATTLNLLPGGTAVGTLDVSSLVSGTIVGPTRVTLTQGQTTPTAVSVSYQIPSFASVGAVVYVPFVWTGTAGRGNATLRVSVTN